MYEFCDYVKPKYGKNAKLCHMDTDSSTTHVKIDDIYKDIAEDFETRIDSSNFEIDRLLPIGKIQKLIGLMKDELVWQIMEEFIGLSAKIYSHSKDNNEEAKKRHKKYAVKKLNFKIKTTV